VVLTQFEFLLGHEFRFANGESMFDEAVVIAKVGASSRSGRKYARDVRRVGEGQEDEPNVRKEDKDRR